MGEGEGDEAWVAHSVCEQRRAWCAPVERSRHAVATAVDARGERAARKVVEDAVREGEHSHVRHGRATHGECMPKEDVVKDTHFEIARFRKAKETSTLASIGYA